MGHSDIFPRITCFLVHIETIKRRKLYFTHDGLSGQHLPACKIRSMVKISISEWPTFHLFLKVLLTYYYTWTDVHIHEGHSVQYIFAYRQLGKLNKCLSK